MNALFILFFTTAATAMGYNPATGITTYDDPTALDTSAGQPAPSTATSFPSAMTASADNPTSASAAAPQALDFSVVPSGMQQYTPPGMGRVSPQPFWAVDPALLQSALGQVPGFKYDKDYAPGLPIYRDEGGFAGTGGYWVPVVPGNKTTQYASGSAPAGSYIFQPDTHVGSAFQEGWGNGFGMAMAPFLAGLGATPATGGATEAGAGGAFDMGGSAGVFDSFGNPLYAGPGMLPSLSQLGTNFGTSLLNSGGDIKSALKNTAINTGIGVGANAAAAGINSAYSNFAPTNAPSRFGEDVMYADAGDPTKRGMLNLDGLLADQANVQTLQQGLGLEPYTPPSAPSIDPASMQTIGPIGAQKALEAHSAGMLSSPSMISPALLDATAQHQTLRQALGVEPNTPPSTEGAPAEAPAPSPEVVSAQQVESLAKISSALAQMNQGRGTPEDAPQRQDGQTDEQYGQTLADYLNSDPRTAIDPQVLSDAGITPGTPEYYQFVMSQLDSVIGQITDGLDPNGQDLAAQLRTKSREELDSLERALYVRGQMQQLMGSGQYTDPFTGLQEDVNTGGAQVNPSVAAYHRGLYRSASDLARMSPSEARQHVGGMLDRNPDLFGLQGAHNARTLDEILSQQNMDPEDIKRRRGMFAQDPLANLGTMSERDLEATLASLLH